MKFSDIIGQEELKKHLTGAIAMGKTSHAYIITGEADSGKMMLAESFAKSLLCENRGEGEADQGASCDECQSCKQADNHNHPDIIYVQHEKPNLISVDEIREQVNNTVVIKPYSSKYKVYIIDDAEKMNAAAQNSILKTIEEPPSYVVILLVTPNSNALLQTIRSRCVTLETKPVARDLVKKYLMEEERIPDYQADMAASFAQGNVGKAIKLSSSESFAELRSEVVSLARKLPDMEAYEFYMLSGKWKKDKDQIGQYLDLLQVWYRDVLLYKATGVSDGIIFQDELMHIKKQAERSSYSGIERAIRAIDQARGRLNANVSFELTMELMLSNMKETKNG